MRRLLALGVCAVLVFVGCGGGGDSESASTASSETEAATSLPESSSKSAAPQQQSKGKESKGKESSSAKGDEDPDSSSKSTKMVKVPPISSAPLEGSEEPAPGVKTVKGGDNSVQTYGTEASEGERTEAAIALQAFLNARLVGDWEGACSYLAQSPKAQLDKLVQQLRSQGKDPGGCAGVMAVLGEASPRTRLREDATITEVLSFRGEGHVPGDPSYLIFTGPPGKTLYSMPMYLEGGAWKVGLALPSELPV